MPHTYPVKSESNFKGAPAGSHIAICNLVADIGIQPAFGDFDPKRQLFIRFELPHERVKWEKDGKEMEGPQVISSFYTASMHKKSNLRKQIESWLGKTFTDDEAQNFDVASLVGMPCLLLVIHATKGDKTYSNISSIGGVPKGTTVPKPENDLLWYFPDDRQHFDKLPEWLRNKITSQIIEVPEATHADVPNQEDYFSSDPGITDDDIPF